MTIDSLVKEFVLFPFVHRLLYLRHFYIVILEWHRQLVEQDHHRFLALDTIPYLLDFGRVQILCGLHNKYVD